MNIQRILFFLCLMAPSVVLSQRTVSPYNHQIKVDILRATNMVNTGIGLSYEVKYFNKLLSTEAGYAQLIPFSFNEHQNGFRIQLAEKFFFVRSRMSHYCGVEYNFQQSSFKSITLFTDTAGGEMSFYNESEIGSYEGNKTLHAFYIRYGFQVIKNHFLLELSPGIGFKYRSVEHFNKTFPTWDFNYSRHPSFYDFSYQSGSFYTPSISLSFKLGYTF